MTLVGSIFVDIQNVCVVDLLFIALTSVSMVILFVLNLKAGKGRKLGVIDSSTFVRLADGGLGAKKLSLPHIISKKVSLQYYSIR